MEHTAYTSQRAPLPDVWRPLVNSWLGLARAVNIACEVDPIGLWATKTAYGMDSPEMVSFVRRAVNRDMGKGRDVKRDTGRSNRRRTCEVCKGRWAVQRSRYCPECRSALRQRNPNCKGCGTLLPPDRPLQTRYCSDRCYKEHWRLQRQGERHTIGYTDGV